MKWPRDSPSFEQTAPASVFSQLSQQLAMEAGGDRQQGTVRAQQAHFRCQLCRSATGGKGLSHSVLSCP